MLNASDKKRIVVAFVAMAKPGIAPSQRFRYEAILPFLDNNLFTFQHFYYYSHSDWKIIYGTGSTFRKSLSVVKGFFRRWFQLPLILRAGIVFLHRDFLPFGPPVFEFIITRIFGKKLIFDFDDAIWIAPIAKKNKLLGWIRFPQKVKYICSWASCVAVGNQYLAEYAGKYNSNFIIIPTVVDTDTVHNKVQEQSSESIKIGWTGTFTNFMYLKMIEPVIVRLQSEGLIDDFIVISNRIPNLNIEKISYIPWNKESEIEDLLMFQIGVMPLVDDEFSRGKCAFKAIQYMALGISTVASPVGANTVLLASKEHGFLAETEQEWYETLKMLILNEDLRLEIGRRAREHIRSYYSAKSQSDVFKKMLLNVANL